MCCMRWIVHKGTKSLAVMVGRLLDLFDIDASVVKRWQGGPEEE